MTEPSNYDTPIIQQYKNIKQFHEDKILFFCCGDFFEMFFQDAEKTSSILGLTLTKRRNGQEEVPMCGIPVANKDFYIKKLIDLGHKVAICEQSETPIQAKKRGAKLVHRHITAVYTAGTYLDQTSFDNNFILSIVKDENSKENLIYIFYLDITTGDFFYENIFLEDLYNTLHRINPKEIVTLTDNSFMLEKWENVLTEIEEKNISFTFEENENFKRFLQDRTKEEILSMSLLFQHIYNTCNKVPTYTPILGVSSRETTLDAYTVENLNLFGKKSLYEFLNRCYTGFGKRKLKQWLVKPLLNIDDVKDRQNLVKFCFNQIILQTDLGKSIIHCLKQIGDIQRNMFLLKKGKINWQILDQLLTSLQAGEQMINLLKKEEDLPFLLTNSVYKYETMEGYHELLKVFVPEEKIFTDVFLKEIYQNVTLNNVLHNITEHRREIHNFIPNTKLSKNSIIGYFFEITPKDKDLLSILPMKVITKQTLISGIRFTTEELVKLEADLLLLEEEQIKIKNNVLNQFLDNIFKEKEKIHELIKITELIDVSHNLAHIAYTNNYHCPEITKEDVLEFTNGRHPVLEKKVNTFITNDLSLKENKLMFITGPNMGGKSTFMRTTAIIVLLAQIGSFVPAEKTRLGLMKNIFVRIGFNDDEQEGESTFFKEMKECANILRETNCSNTLILFDEICRGTSYEEGMALSQAIIEYLLSKNVYVLLSSHYLSLGKKVEKIPGVLASYTSYQEENDNLRFLYKMSPGISGLSFGIKVSELAGIPSSIIQKANQLLTKEQIEK